LSRARYALSAALFVLFVAALALALDMGRSHVDVPSFGAPSVTAPRPPVGVR
jgi:Ni/Fe-hydrogenase subunit HybB-like protein